MARKVRADNGPLDRRDEAWTKSISSATRSGAESPGSFCHAVHDVTERGECRASMQESHNWGFHAMPLRCANYSKDPEFLPSCGLSHSRKAA
jgi:hypothetical protein